MICFVFAMIFVPSQPPANAALTSAPSHLSASKKNDLTFALSGTYEPLRSQMKRVNTTILSPSAAEPLEVESAIPNESLFIVVNQESLPTIRTQIETILTDKVWIYRWKQSSTTENISRFLLTRHKITPGEELENQRKAVRERLKYYEKVLHVPTEELAQSDAEPELVDELRFPNSKARIELLTSLPPDTIDSAVGGEKVSIPVSRLSPDQQQMVKTWIGNSYGTETDPQGNTRPIFDSRDLQSKGVLILRPTSRGYPFDLILGVYTSDEGNLAGGPMLNPSKFTELNPRREQAAERHRQNVNKQLTDAAGGVQTVTILRETPIQNNEPPLSAYLRELSKQTGLTILGRWAKDDKRFAKSMPGSIIRKPIGDALETLCKAYNCEWKQEDHVVLLRAKTPLPTNPRTRPIVR